MSTLTLARSSSLGETRRNKFTGVSDLMNQLACAEAQLAKRVRHRDSALSKPLAHLHALVSCSSCRLRRCGASS